MSVEHTHHYVQPKCCLEPHNEVGSQCQSPPSPLVGLKLRTFQFYVLCDIPLNLYQEINLSHNTTLIWNQNLLNYHKVFYPPPSSPHFGRWGACHDITKSAGSQTNSKSSNNDSMTAESYKAFIKRLISNWMHTDASSQSLS